MAFCIHCGAQIPDGAKFCTHCGSPVAAPTVNPTPQPQAPARQAPQPQTPQYNQPVQTRPVQPVQTRTTPQGGIVIDAPAGSTVTISDGRPQETQTLAPDTKGEVELSGWEEFVPDGQAPKNRTAPTYQAPPSYQAGPANYRPATPAASAQRYAPAQQNQHNTIGSSQDPSKGKRIRRIIIGLVITVIALAMIFNL